MKYGSGPAEAIAHTHSAHNCSPHAGWSPEAGTAAGSCAPWRVLAGPRGTARTSAGRAAPRGIPKLLTPGCSCHTEWAAPGVGCFRRPILSSRAGASVCVALTSCCSFRGSERGWVSQGAPCCVGCRNQGAVPGFCSRCRLICLVGMNLLAPSVVSSSPSCAKHSAQQQNSFCQFRSWQVGAASCAAAKCMRDACCSAPNAQDSCRGDVDLLQHRVAQAGDAQHAQ